MTTEKSPFAVEKNRAIPKPTKALVQTRYPWYDLEIGDSFFVSFEEGPMSLRHLNCPPALKAQGYRITRRTVTEDGVLGMRFWRVE